MQISEPLEDGTKKSNFLKRMMILSNRITDQLTVLSCMNNIFEKLLSSQLEGFYNGLLSNISIRLQKIP